MGKNKNKKFKAGIDKLYKAPILGVDYEKLEADPTDETAYTYGPWIRCRGARSIDLASQFATNSIPADNNANYITRKKNNGYAGAEEVTALPPEFFTEICQMEDFTEDDETIPLPFATGFEYKEDGVKCRRILYHCELTQLPSITHTTESGDLAIDSDTINMNVIPREGDRKITSVCTEGDEIFDKFFEAVPKPSDFKPKVEPVAAKSGAAITYPDNKE